MSFNVNNRCEQFGYRGGSKADAEALLNLITWDIVFSLKEIENVACSDLWASNEP